jgi:hypothetical protein
LFAPIAQAVQEAEELYTSDFLVSSSCVGFDETFYPDVLFSESMEEVMPVTYSSDDRAALMSDMGYILFESVDEVEEVKNRDATFLSEDRGALMRTRGCCLESVEQTQAGGEEMEEGIWDLPFLSQGSLSVAL